MRRSSETGPPAVIDVGETKVRSWPVAALARTRHKRRKGPTVMQEFSSEDLYGGPCTLSVVGGESVATAARVPQKCPAAVSASVSMGAWRCNSGTVRPPAFFRANQQIRLEGQRGFAANEAAVGRRGRRGRSGVPDASGGWLRKTSGFSELRGAPSDGDLHRRPRKAEPTLWRRHSRRGPACAKPPDASSMPRQRRASGASTVAEQSFIPACVGVVLAGGRGTPSDRVNAGRVGEPHPPLQVGTAQRPRGASACSKRRGVATADKERSATCSHCHTLALCLAAEARSSPPGAVASPRAENGSVLSALWHTVDRAPRDCHRRRSSRRRPRCALGPKQSWPFALDEPDCARKFEWLERWSS